MLGRLYENEDCSACRTLELIGERWSLLILRDAMFRGYKTFSEFQKGLGIATNVLTKRLEGFVEDGLMTHTPPSAVGEQGEYRLTDRSLELKSVLIALTEWGDKWVKQGPSVFLDGPGGEPVELQVRRAADEREVTLAEVVSVPRQRK
jgi:DNA-binding HxlR family transcriptional regulator